MGNCATCMSRVGPDDDYYMYMYHRQREMCMYSGTAEVDGYYYRSLSDEELSSVTAILDDLDAGVDELAKTNSDLMKVASLCDPENAPERAKQLAGHLTVRYTALYVKMCDHLHQNYNMFNSTSRNDKEALEVAYRSTRILWSTTGVSLDMCEEIRKANIIELLIRDLNDLKDDVLSAKEDHYHDLYIRSLLGTLHNIIRRCFDRRQQFRDLEIVDVLHIYMEGRVAYRCYALLILSFILNDQENEKLLSMTDNVTFLVSLFTSALAAKNHRLRNVNFSFHAVELAEAIFMLIVNNSAKKIVVKDLLPSIAQLLKGDCSEREQHIGTMVLWSLAFDSDVKKKILKRKDCIRELRRLRNSPSDDVRKACIGALWQLKDRGNKEQTKKSQTRKDGHVMISYQSDDKNRVLELKEKLKTEGYNVWIDADKLDRSTLSLRAIHDTMQEAFEKASVVIICASDNYKYSNLCRSEAEYIRELEKPVVFTRVQAKFVYDGWLGELAGDNSKIFDVSSADELEDNFKALVDGIGNLGKETALDVAETGKGTSISAPEGPVELWVTEDVTKWLRGQNLGHLTDKFQKYSGKDLLALQKMLQRAPPFFYESLKNDLGIQQTHDIVSFTNALENIGGYEM